MLDWDQSHHLQLVLDSTPDGITVQRPDGSLIYTNAAAARLLGFDSAAEMLATPPAEIVGRFEMMDEEGNPFSITSLPGRQAMQGIQAPDELLIQFRRLGDGQREASGPTEWSIVGARPVSDENGRLLFVVNTFRHVTDYMRVLQSERETRRRAEEAEMRLAFLARSSEILSESLDYDETLSRVSQLVVPEIADWCAVDLYTDLLERVSVAHVDPARVKLAYELHRRYPPREELPVGLYQVLRTGRPELYNDISDELLEQSAVDEEHLRLLRQVHLRALLIVPLKGRERVLGAITMAKAESGGRFSEEDLALATELAQRAAMAVDNARLYTEARQLNVDLEERVARRTAALRQSNQQLQEKVEEILEAEKRFRALLESAPDAMVIVGPDGAVRLVNSQAQSLFGYERAAMLGMPVEKLMPDALRDIHIRHRHAYAREPRARPMGAGLDLLARHKDGHEIPVEISLSPLQSEDEILFIAAVRDVSERRRTEEQRWRSEMQLAQAQAIAHLGSWEWDFESGPFYWSKEMQRIFGVESEEAEWSYEAFVTRIHPDDRERVVEAIRAAYQRGIPFSLYHRLLLDDGITRTVHAQGTVETDRSGKVVRVVGTSQDITMQQEIDEELRRSEALYRAMAENLPNGSVLVVDRHLRYQLARGSAVDFDISDWEGRTVAEVAPDPDWYRRVSERYQQALAGHASSEEVRRAGRVLLVQTAPLVNAEGEVYAALTLVQNVTRQREAEETTVRLLELSRNLNATLNTEALVGALSEAALQLARADGGRVNLIQPTLRQQAAASSPLNSERWSHLLHVPIVSLSGETLGFLEAARESEERPFSAADRERLEGLAQIAAIALQNALSFQHLRTLGQQLLSAQEAERSSLSRELHDSTGQLLMALKMSIAMLQDEITAPTAPGSPLPGEGQTLVGQVDEIAEMVDAVYEEIRAVSHALRPPALELSNIDEALQGLCHDYARLSGLQIEYQGCDPPALPEGISISLYRLLQEALTNVAKHAGATRVEVRLQNGGEEIQLSVADDGKGFHLDEVLEQRGDRGVGLVGLQERFELLGGRVRIHSEVGQGTLIAGAYRLRELT